MEEPWVPFEVVKTKWRAVLSFSLLNTPLSVSRLLCFNNKVIVYDNLRVLIGRGTTSGKWGGVF